MLNICIFRFSSLVWPYFLYQFLKWQKDCFWRQGCTRPRPSPFWRPRTRYNGVSDPLRGGVRLQDFGPRGVSITEFLDFRERSARNGVEGAVLENFEDFLKVLPNWCCQKALKLNFKDISDGPIFVSGRWKNLKFSPGRSKSTYQRPDAQFCAIKAHNWAFLFQNLSALSASKICILFL